MPFEEINGNKIYYEVQGDGNPIFMVQGLTANTDWWDPRLIEGLSEEFKVVTFDNRGAGRSESPDEGYSIKDLADDVADLMEAMEVSSAHVLGISMGGMISQELVLNHPNKVDKLVLLSTYCGGSEAVEASEEVLESLYLDRKSMSDEEIIDETIPLLFTEEFIENKPEFIEIAKQRMMNNVISQQDFDWQAGAIMEFDTYDRLPQIENQTLILHGKEDILIPSENGKILNRAIPNSKLVYFENSAHGLMEEMERVVTTVLEFLRE